MGFSIKDILELAPAVLGRYCNNKYELDELVAEVWLAGRAPKAAKISHCRWYIKRDAIAYMRRCEGRVRKIRDGKGEVVAERREGDKALGLVSLDAIAETLGSDSGRPRDTFEAPGVSSAESAIGGELRRYLLAGLEPLDRLVLTMTAADFTCREIGEVAGRSESRICQVRLRLRRICRAKLEGFDTGFTDFTEGHEK